MNQRFSAYDVSTISPSEPKILTRYHDQGVYAENLLYLRYRHRSNAQGPNRQSMAIPSTYPEWLRVCQMFMDEGIKVFMRNAEWYFNGYLPQSGDEDHWTNRLFTLDTSKVTCMHLYVNNLANFEALDRYEGMDSRSDMEHIAKLMRATGMTLKEMRFVGHSYLLSVGSEDCAARAHGMMRNLVAIFHDVGVRNWEFGIVEPNVEGMWVLYDWVVNSERYDVEGYLKMVVRELQKRRIKEVKPGDDLENLLPQGWVKKRPECVCLDCTEERADTGTGGWGPRPDQFGGRAKEPWERRYTRH